MASFTCRPDRYLNTTELTELFTEFNTSMIAGLSAAAIFSSLVNSVRQVYLSAIIETREELLCRYKDHTQELAALKQERNEERGSPPKCLSETAASAGALPTLAPSKENVDKAPLVAICQTPIEDISWPAKTFPLFVGSTELHCRRDMTDWRNMDMNGWTLRLELKVFKYQEPGTSKVYVMESTTDTSRHRILVCLRELTFERWKTRMAFYAYLQPRPGTDLIWVGQRTDPDRYILVKGGSAELMPGWTRGFEFWVPK